MRTARALAMTLVLLAPGSRDAARAGDAHADLERWCDRLRRAGPASDALPDADEADELVARVDADVRAGTLDRWRALLACLALQAVGDELWQGAVPEPARLGARLRELARGRAAAWLETDLARRLASEVLLRREGRLPRERCAAAALLGAWRTPDASALLLLAARDEDAGVRGAAAWELAGERGEGVHALFVDVLRHGDRAREPRALHAAEKHFRGARLGATSEPARALAALVAELLAADDWREVSRAAAVSRALPDEVAIPALIAALERWIGMPPERAAPRMRVQRDCITELERRSGRRLGAHPERWRAWWKARQEGRAEGRRDESTYVSEAAFFGLRPRSDRLVFVLDGSGSMRTFFRAAPGASGTAGLSRYETAVEEMLACLASLGESARFNVVVFDDAAERWRKQLAPATPENLRAVRAWCLREAPDGGTHLRRGIDAALGIDGAGRIHPERLEHDWMVVLCDGATSDGPAWVEPLLWNLVPRARLVFQCVQIGIGGDGTLERLARESGGELVRIED